MKLDRILISIALILLLLMILTLGYLFIRGSLQPVDNIERQGGPIEENKILNLDKEKEIKNPSEEDISNLIDTLKDKNKQLDIE